MHKTIHKFKLHSRVKYHRLAFTGAYFKPVFVANQNGELTLWAEVIDPYEVQIRNKSKAVRNEIEVCVVGTGETIPVQGRHVGTAMAGLFVWHVYINGGILNKYE